MSDVFSTLGHFGNLRGEQVTSAASQGVDQFAQVFTHRPCFAKSHPVSSKSSTGEALKICCREFEVPERLISDGSKQQTGNNSQFKKTATHCNVIHNVIEPNMHNHNPVEGAIRNIRKDWHRVMIQKQVLRDLWDHNMNWVTEIISLKNVTTAAIFKGNMTITEVTGETCDVYQHLYFGFCGGVWFKSNAGLSLTKPGLWLRMSKYEGGLMIRDVLKTKSNRGHLWESAAGRWI